MSFLNLIIIFPEAFLLNFILIFFWVGLYLKKQLLKGNLNHFFYYSVFLLVVTLLLVSNASFTNASAFSSSYEVTLVTCITKLITLVFASVILLVCGQLETSNRYSFWVVEINTLRLLLITMLLLLISINNLIYMFFTLEVLSLGTYILVSHRIRATVYLAESALKYFLIGSLFSILMAYSIVLIYLTTGLTNFADLVVYFSLTPDTGVILSNFDLINIAISLLLVSFLFKIVAAPFHFWAPDVYDGVSVTNMFFLFVIPKIALLTIIIKLDFLWIGLPSIFILSIAAMLSIVIGSVLGLFQKSLKRLLTYSMINNNAFFLLGILLALKLGYVFFYFFLTTYSITLIGLFTVFLSLRERAHNFVLTNIWLWTNLFFIDKARALCFGLLLFSSAGVPPLVGFISKFFVLLFSVTNNANLHYLVVILLIFSTLTCFYYVRLIKIMSFNKRLPILFLKQPSFVSSYVISFSIILLFLLSVLSGPLVNLFIVQFI